MLNNTILSLIEFVIGLSLIMILHELGHYLVGKLSGIQAEEFGFGFPPRLLKLFTAGGTDFTLNLIPFGAFVRFKGEMDSDEPGSFYAAGKWQRFFTLLAGPIMNILTSVLLIAIIISQVGIPQPEIVQIAAVEPGSPAAVAGILPGDVIQSIQGVQVDNMLTISEITHQNLGRPVKLEILRNEKLIEVSIVPRQNPPEGQGAMGIVMQNPVREVGFIRAVPYSAQLNYELIRSLLSIPSMLMQGEVQSEDARLLSPKGVFDIYSQVREEERPLEKEQTNLAFLNIGWFFAIISVSFGFTNLLPIPALDGGRILFIIPEIFTGKRVPPQLEGTVHFIGYTLLILLMGYVLFQDIVNPVVLP